MPQYKNDMDSIQISIIYEDNDIVVVDKPEGLPVHKNDFMQHDADYLTKNLGKQLGKGIFNVHRLDAKTSGVMVLALSSEVANLLTKQFENKEVDKEYTTIVLGDLPEAGTIDRKVTVKKKTRFKKPAETNYTREKVVTSNISYKERENVNLNLVKVFPKTGRWHQIRQHFAGIRNDIVGDSHHGDFTFNKIITERFGIRRLFLHASVIAFKHPVTGNNLRFESELPAIFTELLNVVQSDGQKEKESEEMTNGTS